MALNDEPVVVEVEVEDTKPQRAETAQDKETRSNGLEDVDEKSELENGGHRSHKEPNQDSSGSKESTRPSTVDPVAAEESLKTQADPEDAKTGIGIVVEHRIADKEKPEIATPTGNLEPQGDPESHPPGARESLERDKPPLVLPDQSAARQDSILLHKYLGSSGANVKGNKTKGKKLKGTTKTKGRAKANREELGTTGLPGISSNDIRQLIANLHRQGQIDYISQDQETQEQLKGETATSSSLEGKTPDEYLTEPDQRERDLPESGNSLAN